MASIHKRKGLGKKASSLDAVAEPEVRPQAEDKKVREGAEREFAPAVRASNAKRIKWWADLTVILLVVFVAVVGIFGYRFLRKSTLDVSDGKTVSVAYEVCLQDVPSGTDLSALVGQPLHLSNQDKTLEMGTVRTATWDEDACSVILQVQAEALYRAGDGYRVDGQQMRAGNLTPSGAFFVVGDVSASGVIVALDRA